MSQGQEIGEIKPKNAEIESDGLPDDDDEFGYSYCPRCSEKVFHYVGLEQMNDSHYSHLWRCDDCHYWETV